MKTASVRAALLLASGLDSAAALAAGEHHHGHDMQAAKPSDTAATEEFSEAEARMHADMAITYSNNVDLNFVHGMIPHHQGAVAKAKVALTHSKDAEIRRLAKTS